MSSKNQFVASLGVFTAAMNQRENQSGKTTVTDDELKKKHLSIKVFPVLKVLYPDPS